MPMTILRGGTVVNGDGAARADVLVSGERIAAIGDASSWTADVEHDVTGMLVMPGGIDVHTHLEYPVAGFTAWTEDDFATGTLAAAAGGTTSIIDFVKTAPGDTIRDAFNARRARIGECASVDVGLHVIVPPTGQQANVEQDLAYVVSQGVTSWKFFMAYHGLMLDDGELLRGFALAKRLGVMPMVHAENGHLIGHDTERLLAEGMVRESDHLHAHTDEAEAEAVHRAAVLAASVGVPLYVVHVSSTQAAEEIARLRMAGHRVLAETCPQYLACAYEDYVHLGTSAAAYICSPPIRERANQEGLWRQLVNGHIDVLATDHAGFCMTSPEGSAGRKLSSPGYFPGVPNGVPGIEERLMVLWELGVASGRISPSQFVSLCSTRPAQLFGLAHRKGSITPGKDADILVWDPEGWRTLSAQSSHLRTDYSIYEGMRVSGSPRDVMHRGQWVVRDGHVQSGVQGAYLVREPGQAIVN